MHSLETIARLNAEATEKAIGHYCGLGRWVVAGYTGLHIVSLETFTNEAEALAAVRAELDSPDQKRVLHPPKPADQVAGQRDQSEDRTLAAYIDKVAKEEGITITHNASVAGVTLTATAVGPADC